MRSGHAENMKQSKKYNSQIHLNNNYLLICWHIQGGPAKVRAT